MSAIDDDDDDFGGDFEFSEEDLRSDNDDDDGNNNGAPHAATTSGALLPKATPSGGASRVENRNPNVSRQPGPASAASSAAAAAAAGGGSQLPPWSCHACTFVNKGSALRCGTCGSTAPPSAKRKVTSQWGFMNGYSSQGGGAQGGTAPAAAAAAAAAASGPKAKPARAAPRRSPQQPQQRDPRSRPVSSSSSVAAAAAPPGPSALCLAHRRLAPRAGVAPSALNQLRIGAGQGSRIAAVRGAEAPAAHADPVNNFRADWPLPPATVSDLVPDDDAVTPRIDPATAATWEYPTSEQFEARSYQLQIVREALFRNTLVTLPTGMGKTLIAAVVMYNFYRWFPEGKILFMAPTKPLVEQQVKACYDIVGIPEEHIAELQGSVAKSRRRKLWPKSRLVFCTPQTFVNDIQSDSIGDPRKIVCVVVDEAHRATGDYAYCKAVRILTTQAGHHRFRVLALSATPGKDLKTVQDVIQNLLIAHLEVRSPDDPDVKRHSFVTLEDVRVVRPSPVTNRVVKAINDLMRPSLGFLQRNNVGIVGSTPDRVTPMTCVKATTHIIQNKHRFGDRSYTLTDHSVLLGRLARCRKMVKSYGLGSFAIELQAMARGTNEKGKHSNATREMSRRPQFATIRDAVEREGARFMHPKITELIAVLTEHFHRFQSAAANDRDGARGADGDDGGNNGDGDGDGDAPSSGGATGAVIVFSQFRDSVQEIVKQLRAHEPLIKARFFIGQGSKDRNAGSKAVRAAVKKQAKTASPHVSRGQNQKQQKQTVRDFRDGKFNVLVATCIAEEGLDIGGVDLVVNFDIVTSNVRMVQRAGRTGRKKTGRSVFLLNQEEQYKFTQMKRSSAQLMRQLCNRNSKTGHDFAFYDNNPRMVDPAPPAPPGFESAGGPAGGASGGRSAGGRSGASGIAPRPVFRDFNVNSPYQQNKVGGHRARSETAADRENVRRRKRGMLSTSQEVEVHRRFHPSQDAHDDHGGGGGGGTAETGAGAGSGFGGAGLEPFTDLFAPQPGAVPSFCLATDTGQVSHGLHTRVFLHLDRFIARARFDEFAESLPQLTAEQRARLDAGAPPWAPEMDRPAAQDSRGGGGGGGGSGGGGHCDSPPARSPPLRRAPNSSAAVVTPPPPPGSQHQGAAGSAGGSGRMVVIGDDDSSDDGNGHGSRAARPEIDLHSSFDLISYQDDDNDGGSSGGGSDDEHLSHEAARSRHASPTPAGAPGRQAAAAAAAAVGESQLALSRAPLPRRRADQAADDGDGGGGSSVAAAAGAFGDDQLASHLGGRGRSHRAGCELPDHHAGPCLVPWRASAAAFLAPGDQDAATAGGNVLSWRQQQLLERLFPGSGGGGGGGGATADGLVGAAAVVVDAPRLCRAGAQGTVATGSTPMSMVSSPPSSSSGWSVSMLTPFAAQQHTVQQLVAGQALRRASFAVPEPPPTPRQQSLLFGQFQRLSRALGGRPMTVAAPAGGGGGDDMGTSAGAHARLAAANADKRALQQQVEELQAQLAAASAVVTAAAAAAAPRPAPRSIQLGSGKQAASFAAAPVRGPTPAPAPAPVPVPARKKARKQQQQRQYDYTSPARGGSAPGAAATSSSSSSTPAPPAAEPPPPAATAAAAAAAARRGTSRTSPGSAMAAPTSPPLRHRGAGPAASRPGSGATSHRRPIGTTATSATSSKVGGAAARVRDVGSATEAATSSPACPVVRRSSSSSSVLEVSSPLPVVARSSSAMSAGSAASETFCVVCGLNDREDEILLCDGPGCDNEYHMSCLAPPLAVVPPGDFFGPCCRLATTRRPSKPKRLRKAVVRDSDDDDDDDDDKSGSHAMAAAAGRRKGLKDTSAAAAAAAPGTSLAQPLSSSSSSPSPSPTAAKASARVARLRLKRSLPAVTKPGAPEAGGVQHVDSDDSDDDAPVARKRSKAAKATRKKGAGAGASPDGGGGGALRVRQLRGEAKRAAKAARLRRFRGMLDEEAAAGSDDSDGGRDPNVRHHDEDALYDASDLDQNASGLIDDNSLGYDSSVSSQEQHESGLHHRVRFDSPGDGGVGWLTRSKHGRRRTGGPMSTIEAAVEQMRLRQSSQAVRHTGYACDGCRAEPIVGTRYHCATCGDFDVCNVCFEDPHIMRHHRDHDIAILEEVMFTQTQTPQRSEPQRSEPPPPAVAVGGAAAARAVSAAPTAARAAAARPATPTAAGRGSSGSPLQRLDLSPIGPAASSGAHGGDGDVSDADAPPPVARRHCRRLRATHKRRVVGGDSGDEDSSGEDVVVVAAAEEEEAGEKKKDKGKDKDKRRGASTPLQPTGGAVAPGARPPHTAGAPAPVSTGAGGGGGGETQLAQAQRERMEANRRRALAKKAERLRLAAAAAEQRRQQERGHGHGHGREQEQKQEQQQPSVVPRQQGSRPARPGPTALASAAAIVTLAGAGDDDDDVLGGISDVSEDDDDDDNGTNDTAQNAAPGHGNAGVAASADTVVGGHIVAGGGDDDDDVVAGLSDVSEDDDDDVDVDNDDAAAVARDAVGAAVNSSSSSSSSRTMGALGAAPTGTAAAAAAAAAGAATHSPFAIVSHAQGKSSSCYPALLGLLRAAAAPGGRPAAAGGGGVFCLPMTRQVDFMVSLRAAVKVVSEAAFCKLVQARADVAALRLLFGVTYLVVEAPSVRDLGGGGGGGTGAGSTATTGSKKTQSRLTKAKDADAGPRSQLAQESRGLCKALAVAQMWRDGVQVLFTASPVATARAVHRLYAAEVAAGFGIPKADLRAYGDAPFEGDSADGGGAARTTTALKLLRLLPGVSCVTALLLLRRFGTVRALATATERQLRAKVPSLPRASAKVLVRQLHKSMQVLKAPPAVAAKTKKTKKNTRSKSSKPASHHARSGW